MTAYAAAFEAMEVNEFAFMKWIAQWNKSYATREEFAFRMAEWVKVEAFVQEVNAEGSGETHTATHNKFSDFTREEYSRMLTLGNAPTPPEDARVEAPADFVPNASKQWNTCVTAVKNQEQCGSCYAFSATETVESAYCIEHGKLYTLSPQQIVDCSSSEGNNGCSGGWYMYAWQYLETHGQEEESSYPYKGVQGSCRYNSSNGKVKTTNAGTHAAENNSAIMNLINKNPVSVAIAANSYTFQTYSTGVITSSRCGTYMDHAVAATGYSSSSNPPYYNVRNSWGGSWGDKGYVKIEMTSSGKGICGINQMVYDTATKQA